MKMKLKKLKRKFRFNRKRSYFFLFLFLLVCGVGIGYAALSTTLSVDGSAQFKDARWNVYFNNLNVTSGSVTATTAASITNTTTVSFAARLENPGDFYEFTVDVVNGGNMNAMIDSINVLPELTAAQQNYLSYTVTYIDGIELAPYQKLDAGNTETLKVRFEYLENSDASLYPTEDDNLTIAFDVTYVQADENAVEVEHLFSGVVYTINKFDTQVTEPNNNAIWLNQLYPETIPYFETPAEALSAIAVAAGEDIPFYLKHKIEYGIVTEQYLEFVITQAMTQANSGMVAGTYTLTAEKTFDENTSTWLIDENYVSPYYEANKNAVKTAFGYATNQSRCTESGSGRNLEFFCSVSNFAVSIGAASHLYVTGPGISYCGVAHDGSAGCLW